jgi:hypothetical protein
VNGVGSLLNGVGGLLGGSPSVIVKDGWKKGH